MDLIVSRCVLERITPLELLGLLQRVRESKDSWPEYVINIVLNVMTLAILLHGIQLRIPHLKKHLRLFAT